MPADVITHFRVWRTPVNERTTFLFLELLTSAGLAGVGEASMSGDDVATVALARGLFDELVAGTGVLDIPAVMDRLGSADSVPASLPEATAVSALDQCLWDLHGKASGVPVYTLLGGRKRTVVDLYANINRGLSDRSPESFAERAAAVVADGFTRIKCAPFDGVRPHHGPDAQGVRDGLDRLQAVRAGVGDEVGLLVDCHGRLSVETCLHILPELVDLRLYWLEEPILTHDQMNHVIGSADGTRAPAYAAHDLKASSVIIRESGIRLAGGEFEYGIPRFKELLDTEVLDCLMPDVKYCGGLRVGMAIGELAADRGATIAPHNPSGPVATMASTQLCTAAPAFEVLEYQWGEVTDPEAFLTPYEPRVGGTLRCSDRPGFGSSLNYDVLREHGDLME